MQSVFTISLLLGSTLAVPMNAGKDYALPNDLGHYADKRQVVPPSVNQVNQVNNFVNEAIADVLAAAATEPTSTTALVFATPDPFVPAGPRIEKRQADALTGLLGGVLGGVGKRQADALTGALGSVLGGLNKRQFDGVKSLVETLNDVQVNKRQLEPLTGLLGGLKPEDLAKRQADALTGLLGGVLGGVGKRDFEALKPEHLNKRQLETVTGLLGFKPGQMNKRQLEAVTGLLGPLLGGAAVPGLTPPQLPDAGVPAAIQTPTTAEPTTTTSAVPTVTDLEEFPTFGSE